MANPEAIMRAAQAGPKPPMGGMGGGMPEGMEGPEAAHGAAPEAPEGAGLDSMVESLKGVGAFLQAQGPAAQEAMGHFQALLQSMSQIGGGKAPEGAPQPQPDAAPKSGGRMELSKVPGTQVLRFWIFRPLHLKRYLIFYG